MHLSMMSHITPTLQKAVYDFLTSHVTVQKSLTIEVWC